MRDDHQKQLKQSKQELLAFCLRHGHRFTETRRYWTNAHMACLHSLELGGLLQETLGEYLATHESLKDKVERFDRRIEELSQGARYRERVGRLCCFQGIKAHIALALLAESSDFERFGRAGHFASFLGLTSVVQRRAADVAGQGGEQPPSAVVVGGGAAHGPRKNRVQVQGVEGATARESSTGALLRGSDE